MMDEKQRIEIKRMAHGGDGVGYLDDGRIVFVPTTLPGEVVDIEIVDLQKSYAKARAVDIVEASEERVDSDCAYFPQCGGCQFWHTNYEHEIELKSQAAWETIRRISKIDVPEARVIAAPSDRRYRTRVTFHKGCGEDEEASWKIGFYRTESNELIDVPDCPITHKLLNEARRAIEPALRDVGEADIIFETADKKSVVVTLIPEKSLGTKMPPSLKQFLQSVDENPLVRGMRVVGAKEDVVFGDITVDGDQVLARPPVESAHLPSANFRQAYHDMNLRLVDEVCSIIDGFGSTSVLELYCGNGNFSFALPERVDYFVGLEANEAAIESAKGLAKLAIAGESRLEGFEFRVADLYEGFVEPLDEPIDNFDLVLLDPPRAGSANVCKELAQYQHLDAIVYVSCDPACLGRDLKELESGGWEIESLAMLDMFPRTSHIETIAVLR
jgi:23S rRNA (uracil1939-C5)-methyltransferase